MIKIKVYCTEGHGEGYSRWEKMDYTYCVYVFGILVHCVKIYDIEQVLALHMFGNKIEDIREKYRQNELNQKQ